METADRIDELREREIDIDFQNPETKNAFSPAEPCTVQHSMLHGLEVKFTQ